MKDCCPRILHQFDVVHVSKNTRKKLCAKAKLKKYELLQGWIRPIINHFWRCCATCEENPILLKEKWASVLQHISNEHQWEGFTMYHKCTYDKLSDHDLTAKKWINRVSSTYLALTEITLGDNILRYLPYFTMFSHSGDLEVFHSLYNVYCPKRLCIREPNCLFLIIIAVFTETNSLQVIGIFVSKLSTPRYQLPV